MNPKILKALNEQIKHEFYSSFLYLSMASYFENVPLDGFAKWFRKQAQEEHEHGMKFYNYIIDRNCNVELQPVDKPPSKFKSFEDIFQQAYDHEKKVTAMINKMFDLAVEEGDHATRVFLHWFITEQVEEEKNAWDNLDRIKLVGEDRAALFVIDQNIAKMVG